VGPPFDFYELLFVGPAASGTSVERITLTPAGDVCTAPAKVEIASATLSESVADLFGATNPCTISEKELKRELKRCKNCVVFSGADVAMHVQCGAQARIIRSDILDRDMFDPHPNTPAHTSWTMRLLDRLEAPLGPGVLDRPILPMPGDEEASALTAKAPLLEEIAAGKYDELFSGEPDKPSDLYRQAQLPPPPPPTVSLRSSVPFQPSVSVLPKYPLIARAAHIEGTVALDMDIDSTGKPANVTFESGGPIVDRWLRPPVENTISEWKFPPEAFNHRVRVVIDFALNCHSGKSTRY
jgi:hypothetical protein